MRRGRERNVAQFFRRAGARFEQAGAIRRQSEQKERLVRLRYAEQRRQEEMLGYFD